MHTCSTSIIEVFSLFFINKIVIQAKFLPFSTTKGILSLRIHFTLVKINITLINTTWTDNKNLDSNCYLKLNEFRKTSVA